MKEKCDAAIVGAGKYDVAVIGGGMAGLTAGLFLQKMGKRSIILEHGHQVGGNMSGIWRKGFYFDCGDQSMESFGILFPILNELGLYDPDEWIKIGWRFVTPDSDISLSSLDQVRDDYKKYFPGSADAINEWFNYLAPTIKMYEKMLPHMATFLTTCGFKRMMANLRLMPILLSKINIIKDFYKKSATEVCEHIFSNEPRLKFLFGEYGFPNMPMLVASVFWYIFIYDYNYPKAGIQGLMNKLADAYQERGGEIRLKSTVDKIKHTGNIVTGVQTSKDEYIEADYVINTGNPKRLVSEMLDDPTVWDFKDRQEIIKGEVTSGNAAAYLGVDMDSHELIPLLRQHHVTNWRSYETPLDNLYDENMHKKGWSTINATSLFLPHLAPKGKNSLVVQIWAPYHWMNDWGTNSHDPFARTDEYRKLKEKVLDDIIKDTEYIIPGLSEKIVYKELATPKSLARWTLNPEGSSMGWGVDAYSSHMVNKLVRFKTPLKNLFNAGQYSMFPGGVISACLTGKIVAKGIYKGFLRQFMM